MEHSHTIAGVPEAKIAIRVRGLSHEQRFFDEKTSTTRLTRDFLVIRLRERVDLDSEVHVTNIRTQIGGTYRVAWINTRPTNDRYAVGLELLDPEGEIWESDSIPVILESGDTAPSIQLECQRCYQRVSIPVPEAEAESLGEGFTLARHCEICKSTTGWFYSVETLDAPQAPEANGEASSPAETSPAGAANAPANGAAARSAENRQKGRAPIRMAIKVIRSKYGLDIFDVCETINVSRTGVYFITEQGYDVGEDIEVILNYHPDSMAIPVPARVVRQDERKGVYQKRVAIQLNPGPATSS